VLRSVSPMSCSPRSRSQEATRQEQETEFVLKWRKPAEASQMRRTSPRFCLLSSRMAHAACQGSVLPGTHESGGTVTSHVGCKVFYAW